MLRQRAPNHLFPQLSPAFGTPILWHDLLYPLGSILRDTAHNSLVSGASSRTIMNKINKLAQ